MTNRAQDISRNWRLVCEGLCVSRNGRLVLHDVNLEFGNGQCVSLIGPNGSGKTTLMLALLGLLPPAAGSVRLDGRELGRLPARIRGRFASYVPQTVERLPGFTVYEVVAGGRFPHVWPLRPLAESDHACIAKAIELCGLRELLCRPVNALSGGERQKVLIAAAIAQDAQVMLLDEPNTALDPAYQVELVGMLRAWHRSGRGLILISHDLQLPAALGGRVVALREGRVAADGDAEEILEPKRLAGVYGARFQMAETPDGRRVVLPDWWSASPPPS